MHFLGTIYYWIKYVSLLEHLQQKQLNLKNVEIWKHDYSFDGKGILDKKKKNIFTLN